MNALEQNIMEALAGNPRVNPDEISVEAFGGDVTLRGTVGSVVQREEAVRTTRHVTGVDSVTDGLRLGLLDASRRLDAIVGADSLTVTVRGDAVTLSGTVRSRADHDTALTAAAAAPGVTGVHDEMRVAG